jgi:putative metallohydrolase (TIGR04338 family)
MSRPRDNQGKRLYQAEDDSKCIGIRFETIEDARAYIASVFKRQWTRSRFGIRNIGVKKAGGGTSDATPWKSLIRLSPIHMYEEVALHEIAHIVQPPNTAWHGVEFAGILLTLIERFMGKEAATAMRKAMRDNRVAYGYTVRTFEQELRKKP